MTGPGTQAPDLGGAEALRQEWLALFRAHELYELASLAVKLLAFGLCAMSWGGPSLWVLLPLLWLQDAVLKTFQARLSDRLLRVEAWLREPPHSPSLAMQLNSEWTQLRPGTAGLLLAYAKSALRPTVALPYPFLLLALAVF